MIAAYYSYTPLQIMAVAEEENMESVSWQRSSSSDTELCHVIDLHEKCVQSTDLSSDHEYPGYRNDDDNDDDDDDNDDDDDDDGGDAEKSWVDTNTKPASSCAYCDKDDPVVAFCNTCTSSLCTFCYNCHIRQKQYKSHNVTSFDSATAIKRKIKKSNLPSRSDTGYDQSLSLGESVYISSDCNGVQESNNTSNPRPHDHNNLVTKSTRFQCNVSFTLPPIKIKLQRNKSDKCVNKSKKIATNNSKDDQMNHISHIKWPTRIKTDGGSMGCMFGIGFNKSGIWAVADYSNHRVHVYSANDELIKIFGSKGKTNCLFKLPVGVAFDNKNCLYVSEYGNHRVQKFDANFEYMLQFGEEGDDDGQLNHPMGIAAYKDKVYIADSANSRIAVFYTNGKFCCNIIGGCLGDPYDLAINEVNDQLLVIDSTCCVRLFALDGAYTGKFSSLGTGRGQLNHPQSLAIDSNAFVFVADTYNHRVCIFNNAGMFVRSFGSCGSNEEQFDSPQGIAFSPNGNLYISDYENQRVMIFPTKFKNTTII